MDEKEVSMQYRIKCPGCGVEGSMSLTDTGYDGPYKCWKCRALFTISLEDGVLKSCQPLSQEEFQRQQELDAIRAKFKRG